jgi:GAF domain-containing protein
MKRRNILNRIARSFSPRILGSIQDIRQQVLGAVSWILVAAGFILFALSLEGFLADGISLFFVVSLVNIVYLLVITILGQRISYEFRAASVIVITLLQGLLNLNGDGLVGDARTWFLFSNLFSTILLGMGVGMAVNLFSLGAFLVYGFMAVNGLRELGGEGIAVYNANLDNWISLVPTFIIISLILSLVNGLILRNMELSRDKLEDSYSQSRELSDRLEEDQKLLEIRSLNLERRLTQIRTAAEISRSLGTILERQELLQNVADLVKTRFELYYVGVFLIDENGRYARLAAATGEAGQRMIDENHQLSIGGASMVGWACSHGQPRISQDVGQEAIRFKNPNLPDTRSELALPIMIGNEILGAISVQSTQPYAFDEDDILVLQGIGDSLAIALENAKLFEQFENSLREIQQLNRQYMSTEWKKIWVEQDQQMVVEKGNLPPDAHTNQVEIPITLRGDQVIGSILLSTEESGLSSEDREFVEAISTQAALALESARLLDEANNRVEQERAIQDLTTKFSRNLDFEALLKTIVEEIGQIPFVRETSIHITPPEMLTPSVAEADNG